MITIQIPDAMFFDETSYEVSHVQGGVFHFEHSLRAIAEWESIVHRPFFKSNDEKTDDEWWLYYYCMCLNRKNFDSRLLTDEVILQLANYMNNPHTGTTIRSSNGGGSQVMSAEVIYSLMAQANIPFSCDRWNVHNLMTLLDVYAIQTNPGKKRSSADISKEYSRINKERLERLKTRG